MKQKQPPYQRQNKMLTALMSKYLSLSDMDKRALAVRMHMSRSTLYNRLSDPGSIQLDELRRMFQVLGFTDDEKLQVI